jgi:hypothetical protein
MVQRVVGNARRESEVEIAKCAIKVGFCEGEKERWTLASVLHVSTAMPNRANQVRENKMAKKTLKKSKKIEATKPLRMKN